MTKAKQTKCDICGKLGGCGITQGTSDGYALCYECAEIAKTLKPSKNKRGTVYNIQENNFFDVLTEVVRVAKILHSCEGNLTECEIEVIEELYKLSKEVQ